jgi:hypothetical protein
MSTIMEQPEPKPIHPQCRVCREFVDNCGICSGVEETGETPVCFDAVNTAPGECDPVTGV